MKKLRWHAEMGKDLIIRYHLYRNWGWWIFEDYWLVGIYDSMSDLNDAIAKELKKDEFNRREKYHYIK